MSERLLKLDEAIASGLHPSLPQDQVPLWVDGRNIVFREKSVQPHPGQFVLLNKISPSPGLGVIELEVGGVPNLFWGTDQQLFRFATSFNPPDADDVSSATYNGLLNATSTSRATRWSFAQFGIWVIGVNGKTSPQDPPQIFKTGPNFANWNVQSKFTYAEIVRTIGPFVLVFNTSNGQNIVEWSDGLSDDPEIWTPLAANSAGDLFIRGMPSPILCVQPLGQGQGVYATDGLWIVEFIGAPLFFRANKLLEGIGAFGKDSVVSVEKLHYGMGPRGFFRTDGITFEYIDDPSIHDFVYQNLNRSQASKAIAWDDSSQGLVNFSYPQTGQTNNSITVSFNYRERNWSILDFARSAAISGSVFDFIVTIDRFGNVYQQAIESFAPSEAALPMTLVATARLKGGYGKFGYGQGGYGGEWVVNG